MRVARDEVFQCLHPVGQMPDDHTAPQLAVDPQHGNKLHRDERQQLGAGDIDADRIGRRRRTAARPAPWRCAQCQQGLQCGASVHRMHPDFLFSVVLPVFFPRRNKAPHRIYGKRLANLKGPPPPWRIMNHASPRRCRTVFSIRLYLANNLQDIVISLFIKAHPGPMTGWSHYPKSGRLPAGAVTASRHPVPCTG